VVELPVGVFAPVVFDQGLHLTRRVGLDLDLVDVVRDRAHGLLVLVPCLLVLGLWR
jgi:hypothetical protein